MAILYFHDKQYDLAVKCYDKTVELGYRVSREYLEQLKPYIK
jgi:hypothetical protein